MDDILRILIVLGMVSANAFFVIGEYAVITSRRSALVPKAEAGSAGARAALRLMDDPVRVISTVQVGITALGILTGALGEPLVRHLLGSAIPLWLSLMLAFGIVTYLSVVLGELVPKALTLERAEDLSVLVARPIELISVALRPVVWVLQQSASFLLRPFGIRGVVAGVGVRSPDELRALVDEAEGAGVIPRAQEELLHNVFDFVDREVVEIMVPSHAVAWLEASLTPAAALDCALERRHDRYPVGDGALDRHLGVVHLRDLLDAARDGMPAAPIRDIARPALIVPETKDLGALLREFREQHQHLALVFDEYGGVAGIVTLKDLLEQVVGEIEDEYDLPDNRLVHLDKHTVRVAGSMTIDDFNESVGTGLPLDSARTLAGLVFHRLGRRPHPGDVLDVAGVRVRVAEVDGVRITQLEVHLPKAEPQA